MLEDRSIDIWAYNLETVLAEKLETIITRTTTNTRMRDFYDIYILDQLHGNTLNRQTLHDALLATAKKRGTEGHLAEAVDVLDRSGKQSCDAETLGILPQEVFLCGRSGVEHHHGGGSQFIRSL